MCQRAPTLEEEEEEEENRDGADRIERSSAIACMSDAGNDAATRMMVLQPLVNRECSV